MIVAKREKPSVLTLCSAKRMLIAALMMILSINQYAQYAEKWEFKTDGAIFASPLVEDEKVYIGSADQKMYCINAETGMKIWEFITDGEVHSSPVVVDNLLVFASRDGNLYAIDKQSGKEAWRFSSKGEKRYGLWDYFLSSPQSDGNRIYWGSGDGNLYALESNTGKLTWKYQTQDIVHADPVIHGEQVFIGSFDGNLYALNKENGDLQWKFKTLGAAYFPKGEIQKAVLVDNGTVYFGSRDYNLYALDAGTGAVKWNIREPSGWIIASPVVSGDRIFFGTSDAHKFYSYNKYNGAKVWELPLRMRVFGSAAVDKDVLHFGTFDGKMIAVDLNTGMEKWEFQTHGSRENYATVFNEQGAFKEGFELYGKDIVETEGKILNLGAILCTPVINQNTLYFGSADGILYALIR